MTSSTISASKLLRFTSSLRRRAEVSTGWFLLKTPPRRPSGVRMASTMTTSRMGQFLRWGCLRGAKGVYQRGRRLSNGALQAGQGGRRGETDGAGHDFDPGREVAAKLAVEVQPGRFRGRKLDSHGRVPVDAIHVQVSTAVALASH